MESGDTVKQRIKPKNKKSIVILGGGFGGIYTAKHLEKLFKHQSDAYEIILISRDNYFTYQPMLAEVVGGSIGVLDSVSAIRNLLRHTTIYIREISDLNIADQTVTLSPNFDHSDLIIHYDYLVIALGTVTDFRKSPGGLHEHALPFKNLADAFRLRNRIIDVIETASGEIHEAEKKQMLSFIVGGGGFSGVEVVAEINDFARKIAKKYPTISPKDIRVTLIHNQDRLVKRELSSSLGKYCAKLLKKRGVEIIFNKSLVSATPHEAILNDGSRILSSTIVSTVPSNQNPLLESLPFPTVRGHLKCDRMMRIEGLKNVWAIGDCAAIPTKIKDEYCPHTAQFATRQAKCLAKNIHATIHNKPQTQFNFKALGMMAALGHRRAVAELFGFIKLSGFSAWLFWRFVYLMKLPGFKRKIKVLFSWILELIIPQEHVQLKADVPSGIHHLFYANKETIFHKGDVGDFLYMVVSGKVEIVGEKDGKEYRIATLAKGQYFGEMALLNQKHRNATARCLEDCELIAIRKNDFHLLITNFSQLKSDFEKTQRERQMSNESIFDINSIDKAS